MAFAKLKAHLRAMAMRTIDELSGKPSAKSATSSQTQNAKTTSRPQDMDSTECPML
jgi:hypothetical protein